ncbi:MAG: deoxyguanosine kinase [Saprospiraceae bacterium]|jgi:deoxyguanosine kinase
MSHIVVEGPIGVGKTTLTKRIAKEFGFDELLEQPAENPFLERFYEQPDQYAMQTQLYFLFQRVKQLRGLSQTDLFSSGVVSDFMLGKDPLFAELTLEADELDLYDEVYQALSPQVPVPDLVVYLQASTETLQRRISRRGVEYEQQIHPDYLKDLSDTYSRYFLNYYASPLLIVNAETLNFIENQDHFNLLIDEIRKGKPGRNYFNPLVD